MASATESKRTDDIIALYFACSRTTAHDSYNLDGVNQCEPPFRSTDTGIMGLATKSIFVATTTFVLLLRPSPVGAAPCEVSVETDLGLVIGETTELYDAGITPRSVRRFLGIPYSQPPVPTLLPITEHPFVCPSALNVSCLQIGDHRWKPPRSALPFDKGYFRATEWPDSCPNKLSSPSPFCRTCSTRSNPPLEPNSEDCLKLNIVGLKPFRAFEHIKVELPLTWLLVIVHTTGRNA